MRTQLAFFALTLLVFGCASENRPAEPDDASLGIYRLPYADGVRLIWSDNAKPGSLR